MYKWIASDIPSGIATGAVSEYNGKNPFIEIPYGFAVGSLQSKKASRGDSHG